jgi:ceramide glucosyltransferase
LLVLADLAALLAGIGSLIVLAGWAAVRALPDPPLLDDAACPGVTVLRPLYGDEPLLEAALLSACRQDYPHFQVVFGVQDPHDPALAVVERVRAQVPGCDIALVRDDTADGANRKIANLANMLPAAKHDVLVIADSDIHAPPLYLRAIAAALAEPGIGLVTALYSGLPANRSLVAALAANGITHSFLPGAALARRLGRQDSLGATMALRRDTLAAVGGFGALCDELADDAVLGRLVAARGERIGLAATIPATTVPETTLAALLRHELRWARTIRALAPIAFVFSAVQYPLAWAVLAVALSGAAGWAVVLALAAWLVRALAALGVDRALEKDRFALAHPSFFSSLFESAIHASGDFASSDHVRARRQGPPRPGTRPLLLPLRDLISILVWLAAFGGDRVDWRGRRLHVRRPRGGYDLPGKAAAT